MAIFEMTRIRPLAAIAAGLILSAMPMAKAAAQQTSFGEDVFPIIQIRCLACHQPGGEGYEASGLDLRTYGSLMKGTKFGPMVVPGKVIKSPQTGFDIQLPHKQVGELEVLSFFGDSETSEGSVCQVVSGPTPTAEHLIQFK